MKRALIVAVLAAVALLGGSIPAAQAGDSGLLPNGKVSSTDKQVARVLITKDKTKVEPCVGEVCSAAYVVRTSGANAYGELVIYWNGSQNYAYMQRMGQARGVRDWTFVQIAAQGGTWRSDGGNYLYYAGPVYSGPSAGKCISAYGEVRTFGETLTASFYGACG